MDFKPRARHAKPDEMTLKEVQALWGFGKTRTWQLVTQDRVIPFTRDRHRYYVKRSDAEAYEHKPKRGRPSGT